MENTSNLSSAERAQLLYEKNMELENKRRQSAQAKVPSDPSTWQYMRENYEAIILEDHMFSEKHEIEYALWQLHYKKIEELRALFTAALASTSTNASQGGRGSMRPDRLAKIRSQFKLFLSEASGFYHDLMLKIRSRYGLPLGIFNDDQGNDSMVPKDGGSSVEVKRGLISCHRCLIYLGDLARYKGLYGEGDSKSMDFMAASNYYSQASSLWPSSGNPHHQLAILASYSGDELVAIYRYFRSLAVESPFITARDNLIIAFEKNRQSYTQLVEELKSSQVKPAMRSTGKYRAKGEMVKGNKTASIPLKQHTPATLEYFKAFSIRFVRLNGILFTRTSLETFEEVLFKVTNDLLELISCDPEDENVFGSNTAEKKVMFVRLVAILIFTVHNVNRETENQSYVEILQRSVLLQNAFTAIFEFVGGIIQTCSRLNDPSDSILLPSILILLEWLASNPKVTVGTDVEEKLSSIKSPFWDRCASLLNKLMTNGFMPLDEDEDETCFFNMSTYEDGETNRQALWEDFELRGFLPLLPAQLILDFSRMQSLGTDSGTKGREARIQRIIAAGKALGNIVQVGHSGMIFDRNTKKFLVGMKPQVPDHIQPVIQNSKMELEIVQPNVQAYMEEEDDEVIVFKPSFTEKVNPPGSCSTTLGGTLSCNTELSSLPMQSLQPDWSFEQKDLLSAFADLSFPLKESATFSENDNSAEAVIPSKLDSIMSTNIGSDPFSANSSTLLSTGSRPNPVSRPTRHFGPPPGFTVAPSKHNEDFLPTKLDNLFVDDYSWLDGDHLPYSGSTHHLASTSGNLSGGIGFPFPGKQLLSSKFQGDNNVSWTLTEEDILKHHQLQGGSRMLNYSRSSHSGETIILCDSCYHGLHGHGAYIAVEPWCNMFAGPH